jgi:hypothetical protein
MTASADSKFEVGAVLFDAIHEFSSNDCTEGEGEGIGGDYSICKLLSDLEVLTFVLFLTISLCKVRSMVMEKWMERARERGRATGF